MRHRIEVTAEDIAQGIRSEPLQCPVALACTRVLGKPVRVNSVQFSYDIECGSRLFIPTPQVVTDAVNLYDGSGQMEPFAFEWEF